MFKNIRDYTEFGLRVGYLRLPDFEDRDLPIFPDSFFGYFDWMRISEVLTLCKDYPEYHIVSCINADLMVNGYVQTALLYYLGEGDSDRSLIHDPNDLLDYNVLQSLNSGRKSLRP